MSDADRYNVLRRLRIGDRDFGAAVIDRDPIPEETRRRALDLHGWRLVKRQYAGWRHLPNADVAVRAMLRTTVRELLHLRVVFRENHHVTVPLPWENP